jgi:hypothetical protein
MKSRNVIHHRGYDGNAFYTVEDELETLRAQVTALSSRLGAGCIVNGKITESHAGSAATFALKTLAGNDPSADDSIVVIFLDGTTRSITSPTSLTVSAGSTLGAINATAFRLWFTLIDDAGTLRLGVQQCVASSGGITLVGLPSSGIITTTAEGAAGGADSAGVTYTGAVATAKQFVPAAFAEYDSGLTTAGTWDASPTRIQLYGPGRPLPGQLLNTKAVLDGAVASGSTTVPLDDTIPQNTEGDQYMALAFTPSHKANVLKVESDFNGSINAVSAAVMSLFQDSTANALATCYAVIAGPGYRQHLSLNYLMRAGTTASTTFKIRVGGNTGTVTFNGNAGATREMGGVMNSGLVIQELMG